MARKILSKIISGSHLYGLENQNSDRDYTGVYLPSAEDILGLAIYPAELLANQKASLGARNRAGDVDCKYFSLRQFMNLAAEGQSAQIEMLFARPEHHAEEPDPLWQRLVENREIFLSKSSFIPFVKFAIAQATKATLKGDNLRWIRELIAWITQLPASETTREIAQFIREDSSGTYLGPVKVDVALNESGARLMKLAHRHYDVGASLKRLGDSLRILEGKYGTRSQTAAASGIDHKSLSHAYRMVFEAEELMRDGTISLPLKEGNRELVRSIKEDRMPEDLRWEEDLLQRISQIENHLAPQSRLPKKPDWTAIERLHAEILRTQL